MTNPLRDAALIYAAAGFPVLPLHSPRGAACTCSRPDCTSPGKHPRTKHGLKDATTDAATVRAWWDRWPYANIGIAAGGPLRLVVLDVDPGHGGEESLAALEAKYGKIPETVRAWTGGGGQHVYFQGPEPGADETNGRAIKNKVGISGYPGLDLRAEGGYVVAPPSRHVSGRTYKWWAKETALVDLPRALFEAFLGPAQPPVTPRTTPRQPVTPPGEVSPYALSALDGEVIAVRAAPRGSRNDALNRAAYNLGQLVAGGELDEATVHEVLTAAALDAGLGLAEIQRTLRSGLTGGRSAPRGTPPPTEAPRPTTAGKKPRDEPSGRTTAAEGAVAAPVVPDIPTYSLGELMAAKPPPPEELIADRALCKNTFTMLIGASNAGKTLIVTHLVEALATGAPFLGRTTPRQARVLWFSAEGGGSLLYDRLRHKPIDTVGDDFVRIATLEEIGGQPPRLTQPGTREMLARMVRAHQADVLIIDPLIFFNLGTDEKDTREMGQLAANLCWLRQDTGVAVVVVHHTRKPPQIKRGFNPLDPAEARGAGVLIDLSDSVLAVCRKDEDYWLGFPKRRWGRYLPTMKLALDLDTLRFDVVGEEDPDTGRKSGPSKQKLRDIFEGSLPLGEWLNAAEILRRVSVYFAAEKPGENSPVRNTVRNWLATAVDAEILKIDGKPRKYRWSLV